MSHKLVLATRNQGKITEFRRILEELAPGQIELIGVDQFPHLVDVDAGPNRSAVCRSQSIPAQQPVFGQQGCQ